MWFIILLLIVIAWLQWLTYSTLDGFNEDLKQLRVMVGHIERTLLNETPVPKKELPPSKD